MKYYCYLIAFLLPVFLSSLVSAQNAADILYKAGSFFKDAENYQMKVSYALYKNYTSNEVEEHYQGITVKQKDCYYAKVKETEIVSTAKWSITISNEEKLMLIHQNALPLIPKELDLELIKKYGKELFVQEKENEYHVTIVFNEKTTVALEKMTVRIAKSNYFIHGITYYYHELHDFSPTYRQQDLSKPRLEILFFDYSQKTELESTVFEMATYFKKQKENYIPSSKYEHYELILN